MSAIVDVILGIVTSIGGFIEVGSLSTSAQAGAEFGFQLLWAIAAATVMLADDDRDVRTSGCGEPPHHWRGGPRAIRHVVSVGPAHGGTRHRHAAACRGGRRRSHRGEASHRYRVSLVGRADRHRRLARPRAVGIQRHRIRARDCSASSPCVSSMPRIGCSRPRTTSRARFCRRCRSTIACDTPSSA